MFECQSACWKVNLRGEEGCLSPQKNCDCFETLLTVVSLGRTKHQFRNQVLDQNNRAARVLPWQDTGQKIHIT